MDYRKLAFGSFYDKTKNFAIGAYDALAIPLAAVCATPLAADIARGRINGLFGYSKSLDSGNKTALVGGIATGLVAGYEGTKALISSIINNFEEGQPFSLYSFLAGQALALGLHVMVKSSNKKDLEEITAN